jgi:hypothetical protein
MLNFSYDLIFGLTCRWAALSGVPHLGLLLVISTRYLCLPAIATPDEVLLNSAQFW